MAVSTIKALETMGSATRLMGSQGGIEWHRVGKIITLTGYIQLTATASSGSELFSGLPVPAISDIAPLSTINSSTGTIEICYARNGKLYNSGSWASGLHRISGSYVENI